MRFFNSVALPNAPRLRLDAICSAAEAMRFPSYQQNGACLLALRRRQAPLMSAHSAGNYPPLAIAV
jgi:hypothetical protein